MSKRFNIISKHKTAIITVSLADILSEIQGYSFDSINREDQLSQFAAHTPLKDEDINYYKTGFTEDLKEDSLFQECNSLFNLSE